jgi:uncharacterized protein YukE
MAYAITDFLGDRAAQHVNTIEMLHTAHTRMRNQVIPTVLAAVESVRTSPWLFPLRGILNARAERVRADLWSAEDLVATLLAPVQLPFWLWRNAERWTEVRAELSAMVGDLNVTNREVHIRWRGVAADAYHAVLPAHVAAAAQLAGATDAIQVALNWAGTTAAIFYAMLVAILLQAMAGLLVAAATVVAVPVAVASLVAIAMIAATLLGELAVLVVVTTEAFARMKVWMTEVLSEARDNSSFPNGQWPAARTKWYSDATVTDGDADWSVPAR